MLAVASLVAILASRPAPAAAQSPPTGVIVLDDSDPRFAGKAFYEDTLSFLDASGTVKARVSGLNVCEEIGSPHRVAVDPARNRVWVAETVGKRLLQYDLSGKQLLSIPDIGAAALAVDPATGNLWVARSTGRIGGGWTEVYDGTGRLLATHDVRAYDLAYDDASKAFWLVEQQLLKVSLEGGVLVRRNLADWCAVSVAVDPKAGAVWAVTREYSVGYGRNELLKFDRDGNPLLRVPLGDGAPFRVTVDQGDGSVWVTVWGKSLLHFSAAGRLLVEQFLPVLAAEVARGTGDLWIVTNAEILKMDPWGQVLRRTQRAAPTTQAWLAAY